MRPSVGSPHQWGMPGDEHVYHPRRCSYDRVVMRPRIRRGLIKHEHCLHKENKAICPEITSESEGEDVETVNSMQSNGKSMHHNYGANVEGGDVNFDTVHGQGEVPIATDGDGSPVVSGLIRCMDHGHIRGTSSQNFQDQLDEIDAEIKIFDGKNELGQQNRDCKGIGGRGGGSVEKSIGRVTNYALQSDVGCTPSIISGELCSLKRPREVSSEELGLAVDSRKKQALEIKIQSVEADAQPRRQP
nr:hypothetical protein CFP56_67256 [Quercus suber]